MLRKLLDKPLLLLRVALAIVAMAFLIISYIVSTNISLMVLAQCFMGLSFLIWGIDELRAGNKSIGVMLIGVAFFVLFVELLKTIRI